MTDEDLRLVDRSRNITYQRCPRNRYLEYELGGRGIRKIRANIPLIVGTYVHVGLGDLLQGVTVDDAVKHALDEYNLELRRRGLELEPGEDASFAADEARALIEGLVRAYEIKGLPRLTEQFEVLEVEREDVWKEFAPGIGWMSRADGLLLERSSQDLYVLSFKTAAQWDGRTDKQNQHDVQGLSEAAAIEARLKEWHAVAQAEKSGYAINNYIPQRMAEFLRDCPDAPKVMGVKMIYLLKGKRTEYPEDSGQWRTSSPLLVGWVREGVTGQEFAWRYKWYGPDTWPDSGKLRGHTLGKGWTRFNTWEQPGGVKAWVEMLASGSVQPDAGDALESIVYEPQPYYRQQRDFEDWWEQAQGQEAQVAVGAQMCELIRIESPAQLRTALNKNFPQNRHSCDYPSKCQFQEICHGGDDSALMNPIGTGLYEWRQPHHKPEMER